MVNERQEKFARHYVVTRNATESAKAAGYAEGTAQAQGYRLVNSPDVAARIAELEKNGISDIDVLAEIEKQYEYAKNNNHTQSALKALELLSKVKGGIAVENPKTIKELEEDIIKSLEILGEERTMKLLVRCSFLSRKSGEDEESEDEADEEANDDESDEIVTVEHGEDPQEEVPYNDEDGENDQKTPQR